jgi:excisionase family DNA binding protein
VPKSRQNGRVDSQWIEREGMVNDTSKINDVGSIEEPALQRLPELLTVGEAAQFDRLPDVLTAVEAAQVLRIGRHTLYEAVKRGEIPAIRLGRKILFSKAALIRLWSSGR